MAAPEELVYVSWGGAGRGAALRAAYEAAAQQSIGLLYLAILDPPNFADLDHNLSGLVAEELGWLLQSHIAMVAASSAHDIPTRVQVRVGEVDDEVEQVVRGSGASTVLVGAPVPTQGHATVVDLVAALAKRTGANVAVVEG